MVGEPFFAPGVPIVIDRKGLGYAGPGDLAVVSTASRRPRLERVLGRAESVETVLDGLLVERGERGAVEPYSPPPLDVEGRVDLRKLLAFTIDPETARDFDDAISVRREPGGGLRAWVHIADVSYFVPAGSPLDRGAAARGFSVYVPGRVAPMLPHELADDLCSLRPHEDRLCLTVEIPFGESLEPGEPRFYRSVIRSRERLTYDQAEAILAGREPADAEVAEALGLAERLALELRKRRFARGALRIETAEIAFAFDGRGGVERAWLEAEPHAHPLVEELMILAKLADLEVPTPPAPDADRLAPGEAAALAAQVSERVAEYVRHSGRGVAAFPALVLRALKQARYDRRNLGHSGLASPAYCHFTSPIRRFPDLVVHRALLRELGLADEPLPEDLPEAAEHVSAREREAAQVEYAADEICLAWLLEARLFELGWEHVFEGEIVGLIGSGLFARFGEVFEGFLPARRLPGDYFELTPLGTALRGRRGGRTFRLGDPIEVRVEEIRRAEGKVELSLAVGRED